MKNFLQKLCLMLFALMAVTAYAQSPGQAVMPGQLFVGNLLDVRAPDSEGWRLLRANNSMAFIKRGSEQSETYAAQVSLFKLSPTHSNEEFVETIKSRVDVLNPPSRFAVIEMNYEYTDQRGYPCVRFKGVYEDKEALTPSGTKSILALQFISLFCRHSSEPEIGFSVTYSHRGANTDANLEAPAQKFIEGVQVPQQNKN